MISRSKQVLLQARVRLSTWCRKSRLTTYRADRLARSDAFRNAARRMFRAPHSLIVAM